MLNKVLKIEILFCNLFQVPFVLGESGVSDFVVPNFDGSNHSVPLITVYQQKQLFTPNPYTFLQKIFGHDYPVSVMYFQLFDLVFYSLIFSL